MQIGLAWLEQNWPEHLQILKHSRPWPVRSSHSKCFKWGQNCGWCNAIALKVCSPNLIPDILSTSLVKVLYSSQRDMCSLVCCQLVFISWLSLQCDFSYEVSLPPVHGIWGGAYMPLLEDDSWHLCTVQLWAKCRQGGVALKISDKWELEVVEGNFKIEIIRALGRMRTG